VSTGWGMCSGRAEHGGLMIMACRRNDAMNSDFGVGLPRCGGADDLKRFSSRASEQGPS
jgi:hypothetical protein